MTFGRNVYLPRKMFIVRADVVVGQQDRGPDSAAGARPERRIIIERLAAASLLLPDPVDMIQLLQIITRILRDGVSLVHNLLLIAVATKGLDTRVPHYCGG